MSFHQFSSVTQSCLTLCDPMNRSTPGLPVHHQLPEFTQTHAHQVGDAIQPSHPLSSPSPPAHKQLTKKKVYFQLVIKENKIIRLQGNILFLLKIFEDCWKKNTCNINWCILFWTPIWQYIKNFETFFNQMIPFHGVCSNKIVWNMHPGLAIQLIITCNDDNCILHIPNKWRNLEKNKIKIKK